MLRKLMKHEFRATARIMLPLYLVLLAVSIGANLSGHLMSADSFFLNMLAMLVIVAYAVAIIGVFLMSFLLMLQRFYRNLMGDEGYIMFTLPASIHQQLWSKLIVSAAWFIITGIAVFLTFFVLMFSVSFVGDFFQVAGELFRQMTAYYALNGTAIIIEALVLAFVCCVAFALQFYAAMAIGHSFPNHKLLLSVAFYFGIQFVIQILGIFFILMLNSSAVNHLLDAVLTGLNAYQWGPMTSIHFGMGMLILAEVAYGAIFYAVTAIFLKKRLNLE